MCAEVEAICGENLQVGRELGFRGCSEGLGLSGLLLILDGFWVRM